MLTVTPVACLEDNYAYLVADPASGDVVVVDASAAAPVLAAVARSGGNLVAVLSTHHHQDHVGGNLELARATPHLRIFAHARDVGRVPGQTDSVEHGAELACGGIVAQVLHIPGHTLGAVAYRIGDFLFPGDTLFHAGCGRIFEGTPEMMFASLRRLIEQPPEVRVFPGHEYTLSDLTFARTVEPENTAVEARLARARELRSKNEPTVGAPLQDELETNPFLRCASPSVRRFAGAAADTSDEQVFAALRRAKDQFRR